MPDLVTHTAAAYLVSRSERFQRFRVLFYVGTILPDILSRPLYILWPDLFFYTVAIHTPVFILLFTLLVGEFFQPALRQTVRLYLLAGIALHFLLDLFHRYLLTGYYWLFPFSWSFCEIGLFWPETPVRFIPLWIAIIVMIELLSRLQKHKRKTAV